MGLHQPFIPSSDNEVTLTSLLVEERLRGRGS